MKTFNDLNFGRFRKQIAARMMFKNRFEITVCDLGRGMKLYMVSARGPTFAIDGKYGRSNYGGRVVAYPYCSRDKVEYLMRVLQTDPEKVMKRDC